MQVKWLAEYNIQNENVKTDTHCIVHHYHLILPIICDLMMTKIIPDFNRTFALEIFVPTVLFRKETGRNK